MERPLLLLYVENAILIVLRAGQMPSTALAMSALAARCPPAELEAHAYALYERFRPEIPAGTRGWGAKGVLDLAALARLGPRGAAKRG